MVGWLHEVVAVREDHYGVEGRAHPHSVASDHVEPGCKSVGAMEITRRISAVAVCCSRASVSSRRSCSFSLTDEAFVIALDSVERRFQAWLHPSSFNSISAFSSQNRMSISRYIVVAVLDAPAPARACPLRR